MSQHPKALFKFGGVELIDGENFTSIIAHDEDHEAALLGDGWHSSPDAAKIAEAKIDPPDAPDGGSPTRAELEQKANELNIRFDGRTSDEKLAAKIAEALK